MSKAVLIGIVAAAVIVVGGGAAYFLINNSSNSDSDNDTTSSSMTSDASTGGTPSFSPQTTTGTSFVAKLNGTTDGEAVTATVLYDGKGNSKYTSTSAGATAEVYITEDSYITCQDGMCYEVNSRASRSIDSDDYTYSAEKNKEFQDIATYVGKDSCPAGTCNVWKVEQDGNTTMVYVGNDNRISKLTAESANSKFTYTYEYKPVTITVPTDVRTLPTVQ
jgi:hypothetical protein